MTKRQQQILILTCKSISLKQKTNNSSHFRKNQILSLQENSSMLLEAINFTEISKTIHSSTQGIMMGTCKRKAHMADLSIFQYVQGYSHITRHLQDLLRHIEDPAYTCCIENLRLIKKTWYIQNYGYTEPCYIEKPGMLRTWGILKTLSNTNASMMEHFLYFVKYLFLQFHCITFSTF